MRLVLLASFGEKGDRISRDGLGDGATRLRAEALQRTGAEMEETR